MVPLERVGQFRVEWMRWLKSIDIHSNRRSDVLMSAITNCSCFTILHHDAMKDPHGSRGPANIVVMEW